MQHPDTNPRQATAEPGGASNAVGASHTPGPWIYHRYSYDGDHEWSLQTENQAFLLFNFHPSIAPNEARANARLIASAPKLLTAVKALIPAATIAAEMLSAVGKTDEATAIFKAIDLAYQFKRDAEGRL